MDDVALRNAMSRRERLAAEINKLQSQIDDLKRQREKAEAFIAEWHEFAEKPLPDWFDEIKPASADADETGAPKKQRTTGNSRKEDVADATRKFLQDAQKPIERADLLAMLQTAGLKIEGASPDTVLSTMLWRTRDTYGIVHLRGFGYWLKERPWGPAAYDPDIDDLVGAADYDPPEGADEGGDDE